jgi:hypothetical protein
MDNISWRHHYIPQFYLNGFTSADGKFKIYNVNKKQFLKNGNYFSPESFFYEKEGNTMIANNMKSDSIEKEYSDIDEKAAKIFNQINNSTIPDKINCTSYDFAILQYFIGVMYYRIPSNFDKVELIISQNKRSKLGLVLKNSKNEVIDDIEFEKKLFSDENYLKTMKIWIPGISYPELFNCNSPLHIITFPVGLPSICSDNPIICHNPETFRVYSDDYIFPLNNSKILMRGNKIPFMSDIKFLIDMLIFKQAKNFVSCTEERYLEELDKQYEDIYKDTNVLRSIIFNEILGYSR